MNHAIVMGGSIGGMCAAAALAKNFDRVTVLERDAEPEAGPRRGVPQGGHIHVLLQRCKQAMSGLFPGLFEELAEAGSISNDLGSSWRWFQFGSWKKRTRMGLEICYQSRPLLEHHVRQCLARHPRVEMRFGATIDQPIHEDGRVTGVRLVDGTTLTADLVVDATGRGTRSPRWLKAWGYGEVETQQIDIGLGYVSGIFELPEGQQLKGAVAVYHHDGSKRGGIVAPIEGGRVVATLIGYHGDHAPLDLEGFRAWAHTLPRRDFANVIQGAKLVGRLRQFKFPKQIRRLYPQMRRYPDRYLVLGDAMSSLDPTFGQGMLVASLQAERLSSLRPGRSTRRMQRRLFQPTQLPFTLTATEAHRLEETQGWQPPLMKLQQALLSRIYLAAACSSEVYGQLMRIIHFVDSPLAALRPRILWALIRHGRAQPRRQLATRPEISVQLELSSASLTQTGF